MERSFNGTVSVPQRTDGRRSIVRLLPVFAVLGLSALLFFARLGERALWSMELRWAEIPREMLVRGDYFWPTINGRSYYDKPLGSYWLVVASSWLTGTVDETAARLPCAACGLLSVALLMYVARRLYDGRTAILAGFILATCFSFVFFARTASADMENVTGLLAALALYLHCERQPRRSWLIALWSIMALTSLTKGLLGFALPLLILGVYSCLSDGRSPLIGGLLRGSLGQRFHWIVQRNGWLFNRWSLVAIPLAILIYLLPFAISQARSGSDQGLFMVYRENVQRFFAAHNHRGPVYLYVYVLFGLMAPWSALLPAALVQAHANSSDTAGPRQGDRFARVFFWTTFAFFTLASSRRSYYLMPILPAGALLVARLLAWPREMTVAARRLLRLGFVLTAVVLVVAGVALLFLSPLLHRLWADWPGVPCRLVLGLCWLVSMIGMIAALRRFQPNWIMVAFGGSAYLLLGYLFLFALPALEAYRGERMVVEEVRHRLGPELPGLALYRTREPVFYLGRSEPIAEYTSPETLAEAVRQSDVRWILARRRDLEGTGLPLEVVTGEPVFTWEGTEGMGHKLVLARVAVPK